MNDRVRLRDIAERLGVSHVTVSLALRNHPRISKKRCREVQDLAREMGYRPDPMLSSLSVYRQKRRVVPVHSALAWINHWKNPRELRSYQEFDSYWRGACEAADRFGYHVEEFVWDETTSLRRIQSVPLARNVRGILIPPHQVAPDWGDFPWAEFSVIQFGVSVPQPEAHLVTTDQLQATMMGFRCIRERGYRRVAFAISPKLERNTGGAYGAGFLRAQQEVPKEERLPILSAPDEHPVDLPRLAHWLERWRPDAVLVADPRIPPALAALDIRIGKDLGLATTSVLDGHVPAGISQNSIEIGKVAVEMLIGLIHINEKGIPRFPRRILVEGTWVDGPTLPRRPAAV